MGLVYRNLAAGKLPVYSHPLSRDPQSLHSVHEQVAVATAGMASLHRVEQESNRRGLRFCLPIALHESDSEVGLFLHSQCRLIGASTRTSDSIDANAFHSTYKYLARIHAPDLG